MNQYMLAAICRIIIGPTGHRLSAYPNIQSAYMDGLFADFYRCHPRIGEEAFRKYCRGARPYPRPLIRHYSGPAGYRRTLGDTMGICDACPCISLLRDIQADVHRWVREHLSEEITQDLNACYVPYRPSRRQIAEYLASILHYGIDPSDHHGIGGSK